MGLLNKKDSDFQQYWPDGRPARYLYFVVEPIAEYLLSGYTMREFKITDARDGQSRTIRHFQIQDFFDENVDQITEEKVSLIIDFISVIQQTREQFGIQRNPVIVQSEDGSKRVCLFSIITHA